MYWFMIDAKHLKQIHKNLSVLRGQRFQQKQVVVNPQYQEQFIITAIVFSFV
jgi:hypothetical protein